MAVDKVLSKLTATNGREYFLLTTLHENGEAGFDLALVHEDKAWTGTLLDTEVEKAGDKLKMEYEDFVAQTRKAFTRQNVGGLQFQYTMKAQRDTLTFTWKKHIAADDIRIQLGSVVLKEEDSAYDVTASVFEHALSATTKLQAQITTLQADKERLTSERASALKRLEKCVATKEDMEQDMYDKFAIVVNDKKAKIRHLRDQLAGASSTSTAASHSTGGEGTSGHKPPKTEDSGSEMDNLSPHDSEYETDEDKSGPSEKKPRPSKAPLLSNDDSLMLDDTPTTPAAPRRKRRPQENVKKQTPSRPVIPKCSSRDSTPRPGGSSRRVSLNKSGSNTSRGSQDMDKLLDEMCS